MKILPNMRGENFSNNLVNPTRFELVDSNKSQSMSWVIGACKTKVAYLCNLLHMKIELLWRADRHFSDLMEKYMQLPFPVACGFRITRFPYIRIKRQIGL